jgi:RNA-binding protein 5/10
MSYSRDWDKGKSAWDDSGDWGDTGGRGNVRLRDEDHQGDGKRRKYNNGVRFIGETVFHVCS